MLKLDLKRVFHDKGIENPNLFLRNCGITSYTASRLLGNKIDSISFRHLETICLHLNCTIDDLCAWTPGDKKILYDQHPLNKLKRDKPKDSVSSKLKGLTLDKLDQVRNFINELEKSKPTDLQ